MTIAHEISNDLNSPPPTGPDGKYQSYKELIEEMDKQVGRLVRTLDQLDLREKTLILFTTDNGTPKQFITRFDNGEYIKEPIVSKKGSEIVIGGKSELTDAGTHVPLIANWSGTSPTGKICEDLIDFSDFMPTLAELCCAELPTAVNIDGRSFAPQIRGKKGNPRDWIFNQFEGDAWVRTKQWKLYRSGKLFDMLSDPLEKNPLPSGSGVAQIDSVRNSLQVVFEDLFQMKK
jgi:arylsulfatase A